MKRPRIAWALVAMTVSGAALAAVWPHARESRAMLVAQDDPAELSDVRVNSVLRNSEDVVAQQIGAALVAQDAGLAQSFVDLAKARNIALPEDLLARVNEAATEASSISHFARRFAVGLVTGNADDAGSLSGTVAGDLFVFGDIRDVVREGKHIVMSDGERIITIPRHNPVNAFTMADVVRSAGLSIERFQKLL